MSQSSQNPARRAEELALRMLEHGLSDAEHAELLQCLQQDDAAREQFLEQAFLHSLLREQSTACQPGSLASQLFGVRPEELSELNARLIEAREPATAATPIAPVSTEADGGLEQHGLSTFFRASGFALSAFLAVVAFATVAALVVKSPSEQGEPPREMAGAAVAPVAPASPESLEVRSVRLDFGTTRLSLPKVGYLIIEGPAELDLLGPMRAKLSSGRIKMRVTEPTGKGFVIETPYGDITDLGTEFGVDLTEKGQAGLVVFEGSVDLRMAEASALAGARVERLVGGEGVIFNNSGQLNRVNTIFTGNSATFLRQDEVTADRAPPVKVEPEPPVIIAIDDNLHTSDTKKFYAIVPGGLRDDARAYVDAIHEWNGVTSAGIPSYLVGADYVRTFNRYSIRKNLGISVTLSRPAKLYVFVDVDRSKVPAWVLKDFRNTGDRIGLDAGPYSLQPQRRVTKGAGDSIDEEMMIWVREIREPGLVQLGTNIDEVNDDRPAMYGIAAVPLDGAVVDKPLATTSEQTPVNQ